jgi:FkbM family methyltransferase
MKYYSQFGQDKYVLDYFKQSTTGVYVDIGANNGITASNTKTLEDIGWTGTCIEPNPIIYQELIRNRKCKCIEGAISNSLEEYVYFCKIDGYSEMLSGVLELYDETHIKRILNEQKMFGGTREKIRVKNYTFNIIDTKHIDYLSIDVECGELNVLQSIDFNKYHIKLITVENNNRDNNVKEFLAIYGFKAIYSLEQDDIYENTL